MAPITVTSSPREGCARAPTLSMRAMTDWMSSSVAVGFITIIMCVLLKGPGWERYGVLELRRSALGPEWGATRDAPTERLAKSPGAIRVGTTERPVPGRVSGTGGRRGHDGQIFLSEFGFRAQGCSSGSGLASWVA